YDFVTDTGLILAGNIVVHNCTCYIEGISEGRLAQLGKTGPDQAPEIKYRQVTVGARGPSPRTVMVPEGIDPGFAYAPGSSIAPQVQDWVQELLRDELDSDLATALTRFIARTPPAPPPPVEPQPPAQTEQTKDNSQILPGILRRRKKKPPTEE
ncbi:MAG: hypothetical protein KGL35_28055, partial [Bradyrhizobium sp.]|nr:hypothetical protein [Bradyrhizobium sp.]